MQDSNLEKNLMYKISKVEAMGFRTCFLRA
jgi:hypothetical protein